MRRRRYTALLSLSLLILAASALVTPHALAAEGETEPIVVCYVEMHIHEYPRVDWDGSIGGSIGIERGEYHPHQTCVVIYP